jgi:hypothetical protein
MFLRTLSQCPNIANDWICEGSITFQWDHIAFVLDYAARQNYEQTLLKCIDKIEKNRANVGDFYLDDLIDKMKVNKNPNATEILTLIWSLRNYFNTNAGARLKPILTSPNYLTESVLAQMDALFKFAPIPLDLTHVCGLNDIELKRIMDQLPHLQDLTIHLAPITTIPGSERLKKLNCTNCPDLTSLNLPIATHVMCGGCRELRSLSIPLAIECDSRFSPKLKRENIQVSPRCNLFSGT